MLYNCTSFVCINGQIYILFRKNYTRIYEIVQIIYDSQFYIREEIKIKKDGT